jgi:hypothetical protein
MGFDYSGGMIVGNSGDQIIIPEEFESDPCDWVEQNGMVIMNLYYDADMENSIVGFTVDDIKVEYIDDKWLENIRGLAKKFETLTGVNASLIGTQNIR